MAKKDTLNPALPLLVGSKPSVKPKPKPKPKPTAKPVLDSNYKFVFDPSGRESEAVQALFADRTGGDDLLAQPDPQEALKASGVIKPPTSSRGRALDRGATRNVYSSAQDALDALGSWMDDNPIPIFGDPTSKVGRDLKPGLDYLNKEAGTFIGELTGKDVVKGIAAAGTGGLTQLLEPASNVRVPLGIPGGKGKAPTISVGEALKAPFKAAGSLASKFPKAYIDANKDKPGVSGLAAKALQAEPKNVAGAVAGGIMAAGSAVGNIPIPTLGPPRISLSSTGQGYVETPEQVRLGDVNVKLQDISQNTNKYIDAASDDKSKFTDDPFVNGLADQVINGGLLVEEINLELQSAEEQQTWSGFSEPDINAMQKRAAKNGWAFDPLKPGGRAAWQKLTPAEWLYYAYTKNSYWPVLGRSLIRAAALTGLAPAGIVAMGAAGVKAAGGNTEDAEMMLKYAIAPIGTFQSDSEKYGVGAAFKNALRDHPDQVVLAIFTVARGLGAAGGVAGRAFGKDFAAKNVAVTVPGDGVTIKTYVPPVAPVVETPDVRLGPGSLGSLTADRQAARVAAQAESDAQFAADVESGAVKGTLVQSPPINAPVEIGVTTGNLLDIFFLRAIKAPLARGSTRYRGRLASKAAEAKVRRQYNVEQGMQIEVRAALSRPFGRAPTDLELDRTGFNLIWPAVSLKGEKITPGWVAQQFQAAIDEYRAAQAKNIDLLNETTGKVESRAEQAAQIKLWEDQITYYRQLDSVDIPEATMAEVRAIAKPMGEDNTRIVAEMMKQDVTATKRANYIRLIASNNDLEVLAKALRNERNASRKLLIKAQKKARALARGYAEKVTASGVGAKSRPKSIADQAEKKANLLAALIEARDAALKVSKDKSLDDATRQEALVLSGRYGDAAARLEASGAGVADRAAADAALVAEIDALTLGDKAATSADVRIPIEPMAGKLWNERLANRGPVESAASDVTGATVEMVRAKELRGMEGNAVGDAKVQSLRGERYENPIIVNYDPDTGYGYVSEGNHRLAAATDDQFVPVQVITSKLIDIENFSPARLAGMGNVPMRKLTDRGVLVDKSNYVPSNLYPHEIGLAVRGADATIAGLPTEARVAYSAAQAAEAARVAQADVVAGLEAQRAAALGQVAPLVGTQPLKSANTAAVRAAQARVDKATARVEDISARTLPSKKELAAATAELDAAEARLARLGAVQEVDVALTGAKGSLASFTQTRNARVREVKAIIAKNKPVLDVEEVTISVDAAQGIAGIKVKGKKDYGFFKIEQARNEVLDDFIARMEGLDQQALLHVMVTPDTLRAFDGGSYVGPRVIDTSPTARVRSGRLVESQGILFKSGLEQAKFWERLLFDTAELKNAQGWQRKINDLIEATCIPIRPSQKTLDKAAEYEAGGLSPQDALSRAVADEDIIKSANQFKVIRPSDPRGGTPSENIQLGTARTVAPQTVEDMFLSYVGLDKLSDGDYLLMPKGVYDGIQDAIRNQSFKFAPRTVGSGINKATRAWRDLTLNIFPKTAFNNFVGSAILAFQAGATPLDFFYAYRAIMGKADARGHVYAFPPELRQRYYEQLTNRIGGGTGKTAKLVNGYATTETAFAWTAYWMNTMRRLNGASEDLSRVAVWYSQARKQAVKTAAQDADEIAYFASMRRLTDSYMDVVEAMARNDPRWESANELFLQKSFDFLGDLHQGGRLQATLRLAIPFYQWYAHILKLTFFTMPVKYPGRALFLQMLGSIGEEYVKDHGILPSGFDALYPMFEGVIPLSTSTEIVGGGPQKVTLGLGSNSWYPQGTVAPFATQTIDSTLGMTNPLIKTPALGIVSTIAALTGSGAFKFKGDDLILRSKDENGNPITGGSELFWWNMNNAMNVIPLAPSLVDLAGRADTSFPILNDKPRPKKDLEISNPSPNVSFGELLGNPSFGNAVTFLGKFGFGLNFSNAPGVGPIMVNKYTNAYESKLNDEKQELKNIADNLARLHAEQNK